MDGETTLSKTRNIECGATRRGGAGGGKHPPDIYDLLQNSEKKLWLTVIMASMSREAHNQYKC